MISLFLTVLFLTLFSLYRVSSRKFDYWKKRKIPYPKPVAILGNYGDYILMKKSLGEVAQSICGQFPNVPYFGTYFGTEPALIVQDPEIIKLVMTKDFYYFSSREVSDYSHMEVFTQNLFFTYGNRWKVLRQNLSPLFSSSKMKDMFYLIEQCAHSFEDLIDYEVEKNKVVDVKGLIEKFTIDAVSGCAFGINPNAMQINGTEENSFFNVGHLLLSPTKYRGFKQIFRSIWPSLFYGLGMKSFPVEADRFFLKVMTEVFAQRQYKPSSRKDFVDLILDIKKNSHIVGDSLQNIKGANNKVTLEVDDELLVAQCLLFFAAGFDTASSTLQFTFYELAKKPEALERAVQEVDEYLQRHNNKLGYECISELPFIDACIDETMRLYPALGVITRETFEDYELPCGAKLDKGTRVHVPVFHVHRNPEHFPEPNEFKPERFLGDAKRQIDPYTYLPFGEGPRKCIGMRFARMLMMASVITVLKKYRVELPEGAPTTIEFDVTTIVVRPKWEIQLRFMERDGWEQRLLV